MRNAPTLQPRLWLNALWTIPQVDLHSVDPVARWLIMGRAAVLIMTFISAVLGGVFAAVDGVFDAGRFALATFGLVLAHLASNLANDYFDFRHGKDTPDSPRVRYGPHPLAHRGATPSELWVGTLITSAAAALIGLYLTQLAGRGVLAFIAAGGAILLGYTGGPFPLKYHGLGELAVCAVWGPLMVGGTYYVQAGQLPAWVIVASLPYAFGVTTVLLGKHLDKLGFDRGQKIGTLPVVLGEGAARRITQVLVVLMHVLGVLVAAWMRLPGLLLVLGAVPSAVRTVKLLNEPRPPERPLWYVGATFFHNRRYGLLLLAGLLAQIVVQTIL